MQIDWTLLPNSLERFGPADVQAFHISQTHKFQAVCVCSALHPREEKNEKKKKKKKKEKQKTENTKKERI